MPGSTVLVDHGGSAGAGGIGSHNNGGAKGGKRPLPHIDDITSVTADIDVHAPIPHVLQTAETYLRQAESSKNFGRPDLALKDYIRASLILVTQIKKNKGWVSLQNDNKLQFERYQRLLKQIDTAHEDFAAIKAEIKADNARTGVQPTNHGSVSTGGINGQGRGVGLGNRLNAAPLARENGAPTAARPIPPQPRAKPIVHPKPQSLHGNALQSVGSASSRANQAQQLAERFANLRVGSAQASQQQATPQSTLPNKISKVAGISDMPKLPDAIYNPPRGTISNEAAQLPSSTPNMFSRTVPAAPLSVSKGSMPPPAGTELFAPAQALGAEELAAIHGALDASREHITIEEFQKVLDRGTVLVIDIRSREQFDRGHISCQAPVVCIEPEVLARPEISANQIAESMVLAPTTEQLFFENRHAFRQIVFYDQNSRTVNASPRTPQEKAINGIFIALEFYDFPTRLMQQQSQQGQQPAEPKPQARLLSGGFDAWVKAGNPVETSATKISHRFGSTQSPRGYANQRHRWVARPIQDADEVKRWESLAISRTYEDFFQRYPPVSDLRESMTSPVMDIKPSAVTPLPSRPTPALPRRSYTGLAEADEIIRTPRAQKRPEGILRVGIYNPANWCYANSALQALFHTFGFSRELSSGEWAQLYQVPNKNDEAIQAQLLMKFLHRTFSELQHKETKVISPNSLMDYLQAYCRRLNPKSPPEHVFGTNFQQDSQEFLNFLLAVIDDETNIRRDQTTPTAKSYTPKDGGYVANATDFWNTYSVGHDSIVDRYFKGLEVVTTTCINPACGAESRRYQPFVTWLSPLTGAPNPVSIFQLLERGQAPQVVVNPCETCKGQHRSMATKFARLPDRLLLCLGRAGWNKGLGVAQKLNNRVTFPFVDLDLTRFMAQPDALNAHSQDHHLSGPLIYDVYAVTVHIGPTPNSGHYISYVRQAESNDPTDWIKLNDSFVDKVKVGSRGQPKPANDVTEQIFAGGGNASAYVIFLKRRGT